MRFDKQLKVPIWTCIAVAAVLCLALYVICAQMLDRDRARLESWQSDIYLQVMYELDRSRCLYEDLSELFSEAAEHPDQPELRERLTAVLEGAGMNNNPAWPALYSIFVRAYGGDQESADTVRQCVERALDWQYLTDAEREVFLTMPAEDLAAVSDLCDQLGQCFSRSDGHFGAQFLARQFGDEALARSMQTMDQLSGQLQEYMEYFNERYP